MNWHNCHRQQRRLNPLPMASTLYQSHLAAQLVATTERNAVAADLDPPSEGGKVKAKAPII